MKDKIEILIKEALKNLGIEAGVIVLEHPADMANGDYSTNVALAYAKQIKVNPKELACKIVENLNSSAKQDLAEIEKIEVAGAGFINFYLSREFFTQSTQEILKQKESWGKNNLSEGKKVMVEYTDPNPFKPFHIGHLMTNAIGESIARIFEYSGATTIRANYQGDVGPHVAKAFYGMKKRGMPEDMSAPSGVLALYIGECYATGSEAYDTDPKAKEEIESINQLIYDRTDPEVNEVYDWGRKVTLDAFEEIYKILDTKFNHYFFESVMAPIGIKIVKENVGKVFTESDGAIVFHGEDYDPKLHTRVFINSKGLPTYETKEIGLTVTKFEKEIDLDKSIVITAIEQGEYMKVVQKAISLIHPDLEARMKHITHGMMKFASGKMSSRKGNVVTGESLIRDSMDIVREKVAERELTEEEKNSISRIVGVSAVKYSILKSTLTSDILYDFEKSISFEGDSGPYLQYTAVRASGILKKAEEFQLRITNYELLKAPEEVTHLEHLLYQFGEVVARAYSLLEPHHIATYLTELASAFNSFYANTIIVSKDDVHAPYRVALVEAFHQTMKNGLYLLGIETPKKM